MTVIMEEFREQSQRDVVFTPFMLRVRAAVQGELREPAVLQLEKSPTQSIAAVNHEWFELRTLAEHVLSEANAMLGQDAERIELIDEYGTGQLAFTIRWRERSLRICLKSEGLHAGHLQTTERGWTGHEEYSADSKPADELFLENLAVALLSMVPSRVVVEESTEEEP